MSDPKFTWGDDATVIITAPARFRPGEMVSIIGVLTGSELAKLPYRVFDDEVVYAVEYRDGSAQDVEQKWLTSPS